MVLGEDDAGEVEERCVKERDEGSGMVGLRMFWGPADVPESRVDGWDGERFQSDWRLGGRFGHGFFSATRGSGNA